MNRLHTLHRLTLAAATAARVLARLAIDEVVHSAPSLAAAHKGPAAPGLGSWRRRTRARLRGGTSLRGLRVARATPADLGWTGSRDTTTLTAATGRGHTTLVAHGAGARDPRQRAELGASVAKVEPPRRILV